MTATQAPTPGPLSGDDWTAHTGAEVPIFDAYVDVMKRDGSEWANVHSGQWGQDWLWSDDDTTKADIVAWRPASLAPTAPVEASGSEREHGPKCWGKTSFSDEMMYCYCGSTDSPPGETREYPWSFYDALKVAGIEHASFCVNGVTVFGDRSAAKEAERWHHESVSVETYWRPEVIRQRDLLSALALGRQKGDSETLRVLLDNLVIAQTLSKDIRQKATDEARSYLYDLRHTPQPSGETRDLVSRAIEIAHDVERGKRSRSEAVDMIRTLCGALLSARPLALGGQQGCECVYCTEIGAPELCRGYTAPARAEAQDEGAAGEPVAWFRRDPRTGRINHLGLTNPNGGYQPLYAHQSPTPAADADRVRIAVEALPNGTYQKSETVTATAEGEETFAELRQSVAEALPEPFRCAGGTDRIRKGDPVPGSKDRTYDYDRQAHVAFVAHHPRQALAALKSEGK